MLTSHELAAATGLTYRQVDHWTRLGVLQPDVPAEGSGSAREWSDHEARIATVLCRLRDFGAPTHVLGEVAGELRRFDGFDWRAVIYVDGHGMIHRHPSPATPVCWALDLATIPLDVGLARWRVPA